MATTRVTLTNYGPNQVSAQAQDSNSGNSQGAAQVLNAGHSIDIVVDSSTTVVVADTGILG